MYIEWHKIEPWHNAQASNPKKETKCYFVTVKFKKLCLNNF